ncbi:hypothetical protein IscW_ISCW003880 [Ixodes scapularis]|uniref:Uncharacterized protein n=1 Tax=Ixodes scapularis TaxID=6945 RepID=B7PJH3_IXOSC|nr:hypothetical protein IscW_ISCW003880 [Ixodes scapularis]|eukprot:XP_002408035.1 hypothetical protein IscW_ISCW003880 [Ixodes scapularis]
MVLQLSRPTAMPLPCTASGSVVWAMVSATTDTVTGLAPMVLTTATDSAATATTPPSSARRNKIDGNVWQRRKFSRVHEVCNKLQLLLNKLDT